MSTLKRSPFQKERRWKFQQRFLQKKNLSCRNPWIPGWKPRIRHHFLLLWAIKYNWLNISSLKNTPNNQGFFSEASEVRLSNRHKPSLSRLARIWCVFFVESIFKDWMIETFLFHSISSLLGQRVNSLYCLLCIYRFLYIMCIYI